MWPLIYRGACFNSMAAFGSCAGSGSSSTVLLGPVNVNPEFSPLTCRLPDRTPKVEPLRKDAKWILTKPFTGSELLVRVEERLL